MPDIVLNVIETRSNEVDLFMKLVERGEHADIPYYWSARELDIENGHVVFEDLSCARNHRFRVGVAGKKLLVSLRDIDEVLGWLKDWGIKVENKTSHTFNTPDETHVFLKHLRDEIPPKERSTNITLIREKVKAFREAVDSSLIEQTDQSSR